MVSTRYAADVQKEDMAALAAAASFDEEVKYDGPGGFEELDWLCGFEGLEIIVASE